MTELDAGVAASVMTAYVSAGADHEDGLAQARRAAQQHDAREVIDSLIHLGLAFVGARTYTHKRDPLEMLDEVSRMTHTVLLAGFDVSVGVAVMTTVLPEPGSGPGWRGLLSELRRGEWWGAEDEEAMADARRVADRYGADEVIDGLVSLNAALIALLQAETGCSGIESIDTARQQIETLKDWSTEPVFRLRGPRSFAKFITDVHGPR